MLTRRRWLPVIVAVAALTVVGIAAQGTGLQWNQGETTIEVEHSPLPQNLQPEPEPEATSAPIFTESEGASLPPWVSWLILGVLVGIPFALLLFVLGRRLVRWLADTQPTERRHESEPQYLRRDVALVEEAVAAGLAEIDLGTDPRSAIIACWVHFEAAGERVGIAKEPSDTPSDLTRKLLEHHELQGRSLSRLSEAYLRARYSPHEVGEADRDRARSALVDLQGRLGVKETR